MIPVLRTLLLAATLALAACGSQGEPLGIEISNVVGDEALQLGTSYRTAAGDEWTADSLRYYLSNFRLRREDGRWFVNPQSPDDSRGYFLVDERAASSKTFSIGPVPPAVYSGIEFLVGVDAQRNAGGVQSGTLDPARGMFWTWRTGYIFFAFDGRSPQSQAAAQTLSLHLGGGGPNAVAHSVWLPFHPALPLGRTPGAEIHLHADLARLFDGPHALRPAAVAERMDLGNTAELADNSAALFRIDHVHAHADGAAGSP